jgi:hypothetical protein
MGRWRALLSLGPSLLLGCQSALPSCETPAAAAHADYALVEYRLREQGSEPKVEISDTETYRSEHGRYAAAALRLPDACLKEGVSKLTISAADALQPECSAWLGELERALAGAGLRVVAWDALFRLEQEKSLATYVAAKELGADVVFVFNGLGAETVTAGSSKLPKHDIFESDERGARGAPLELDEPTRSAFLKYTVDAAAKSIKADEIIALSTSLDSTAIVTLTGESIWFYRRTAARPTKAKQGLRLLFGRVEGGGWTPAAPLTDGAVAPEAAPDAKAEGAPATPDATSTFAAERLELVRAGAEHLVQAFKSGELGAPKGEPEQGGMP